MLLRYKLPIEVNVISPMKESLNIEASFVDGALCCSLNINCDQVKDIEGKDGSIKYFSWTKELVINLRDEKNQKLKSMIEEEQFGELVRLLCSIANRFIRAIRNFGLVAHLHEVSFDEQKPEMSLIRWNVEACISGDNWVPLFKSSDMIGYIAYLSVTNQQCADIYVDRWAEVQEAVRLDAPPPPEREFTTNSIEHLHLGNLRLAVVESVIGLEIVMTRYLREYLKVYKKLSNERIREFLSREFGLTSRIAGVLHLTLGKKDIEKYDLSKVRKVVKWRNEIVHKTGHLPNGVSKQEVSDCIIQLISLSWFLGYKADRIPETSEFLHLGIFPLPLQPKPKD